MKGEKSPEHYFQELKNIVDIQFEEVFADIRGLKEALSQHEIIIQDLKKERVGFGTIFDSANAERDLLLRETNNCVTEMKRNYDYGNPLNKDNGETARLPKVRRKQNDENVDKEEQSHFRSLIKSFVESSTLHGLSRLTDSSVWIRILWTLALIGAMAALAIQITGLTRDYLAFNVITDVKVEQGNLTFPAITICNNRRFLASKLVSLPLFANLSGDVSDATAASMLSERLANNYYSLTPEDLSDLGANMSGTLCVHTDTVDRAKIRNIPYHGSCYSIEAPSGTTIMWIVFNLHINDSIDFLETTPGFTMYLKDSLRAYHTFKPVLKINVPQGKMSHHVITNDVINRLNGSYAQCQDGEQAFFTRTGITYEQDACYWDCVFRAAFQKCQCFLNWNFFTPFLLKGRLENNVDIPICNGIPPCIRQMFKGHQRCNCKPRCHMKVYGEDNQRHSNLKDLTCTNEHGGMECLLIKEIDPTNISDNWHKTNFAAASFILTNRPYKIYSQQPGYPLLHFLADIGGTMGFYLGASMLTYFELVQLSLSGLFSLFRRLKLNTK